MKMKYSEFGSVIGDPGGNRTRDNLIKSHPPFVIAQDLSRGHSVKPNRTNQYVIALLSNFIMPMDDLPFTFQSEHCQWRYLLCLAEVNNDPRYAELCYPDDCFDRALQKGKQQ